MIEFFNPQKIKIAGKEYENELIVVSKNLVFSWDRKGGELSKQEVEDLIDDKTEFLIISKSKSFDTINPKIQKFLERNQTILVFDKIKEVVRSFNIMANSEKEAFGIFDLTGA